MPDYSYADGTISISQGATTLVGTGTAWTTQVKAADLVAAKRVTGSPEATWEVVGWVSSVTGDLAIELQDEFDADDLVDAEYRIIRGIAWWSGATPNETLIEFLEALATFGLVGSSDGTPLDSYGRENGFAYDYTNGILYQKRSGSYQVVEINTSNITFGELRPANITADTNNYEPTGAASANVWYLQTDGGTWGITGIVGGTQDRLLLIKNIGSGAIILKAENSSSSAANRFDIERDLTIGGGGGCVLIYSETDSRWHAVGAYLREHSQAEAEAGTSQSGYMTALRTLQAIQGQFAADADVFAAVANKIITADLLESASAEVAVDDAASPLEFDWDAGINFSWEMTTDREFPNPINGQPGTYRTARVYSDSASTRTLTFDDEFSAPNLPTLTDISNTVQYLLTIRCITATWFVVVGSVQCDPP